MAAATPRREWRGSAELCSLGTVTGCRAFPILLSINLLTLLLTYLHFLSQPQGPTEDRQVLSLTVQERQNSDSTHKRSPASTWTSNELQTANKVTSSLSLAKTVGNKKKGCKESQKTNKQTKKTKTGRVMKSATLKQIKDKERLVVSRVMLKAFDAQQQLPRDGISDLFLALANLLLSHYWCTVFLMTSSSEHLSSFSFSSLHSSSHWHSVLFTICFSSLSIPFIFWPSRYTISFQTFSFCPSLALFS